MPLWQFRPDADRRDPRWLDHPVWADVVVRAPSAARARLAAAAFERRRGPAERMANESPSRASGLGDDKLYRVRRLDPGAEPALEADGDDAVLRATPAPGGDDDATTRG